MFLPVGSDEPACISNLSWSSSDLLKDMLDSRIIGASAQSAHDFCLSNKNLATVMLCVVKGYSLCTLTQLNEKLGNGLESLPLALRVANGFSGTSTAISPVASGV